MATKFSNTQLNYMRGDTEAYTFYFFTDEDLSTVYNLTGFTIKAQARRHPDDGEAFFDTSTTSGMAIADGSNGSSYSAGKVVLLITAAITAILPEECYYDIQATSGSTVKTLAAGKLLQKKDVTR